MVQISIPWGDPVRRFLSNYFDLLLANNIWSDMRWKRYRGCIGQLSFGASRLFDYRVLQIHLLTYLLTYLRKAYLDKMSTSCNLGCIVVAKAYIVFFCFLLVRYTLSGNIRQYKSVASFDADKTASTNYEWSYFVLSMLRWRLLLRR